MTQAAQWKKQSQIFHNSWNIRIDMQIYNNEDLNIWRQEDTVSWIDSNVSIPVEMYWHQILLFLFHVRWNNSSCRTIWESMNIQLTMGLNWYSLCLITRDDFIESTKHSLFNKKNEQLTKKLRFGIRVRRRTDGSWDLGSESDEGQTLDTGVNSRIGQSYSTRYHQGLVRLGKEYTVFA